jgi:phage RecT family recombinase
MTTQTRLPATIGNRQALRAILDQGNVTTTLEQIGTKWFRPDQVKTQAMLAVARNPELLRCTQASFLESMVRATELGLRFAGAGGEAYLVPYKSACTLIIGYRGLCALARRTGKVTRIEARCVHEKDHFEIRYGSGQQIEHRPHLGPDRGDIVAAYALAELKDGDLQLEVMTRAELDAIMKRSPSSSKGPWRTDFSEMCRKSVVRRLCKYLPFPTAFEDALLAADLEEPEEVEDRRQVDSVTVPGDSQDEATPDGVDPATGEITDPKAFEEQTSSPPAGSTLASQKTSVLSQIWTELGIQFAEGGPEAQAARLRALNHIFGMTQAEKIGNLPLEILKAGLQALKNQAIGAEAQ